MTAAGYKNWKEMAQEEKGLIDSIKAVLISYFPHQCTAYADKPSAGSLFDRIKKQAEELGDSIIADICASCYKYHKCSEKQAFCIARFLVLKAGWDILDITNHKQHDAMEKESKTATLTFDTPTDIVITDPCYFIEDADWEATQYGESLPFAHITQRTGIGDWSCDVINGRGCVIGSFAADTGQCTIAALQDIRAYHADAFKGIARGCVCVIKGFQGTIYTCYGDDRVLHIIGKGNTAFANIVS